MYKIIPHIVVYSFVLVHNTNNSIIENKTKWHLSSFFHWQSDNISRLGISFEIDSKDNKQNNI